MAGLASGILNGKIEFPYDAVRVDFTMTNAAFVRCLLACSPLY
jgi:hypothetical protein